MEQRHCYENHKEVIKILISRYGFRYDGIGDNGEECFRKESATPETIFVHPMHCSYYKSSSQEWLAPRVDSFYFKSSFNSQPQQKIAFSKLLKHLDIVTVGNTKGYIDRQLLVLEEKRQRLVRLALNTNVSLELKELIPHLYDRILLEKYRLISVMR